jgi:hypothetical protein
VRAPAAMPLHGEASENRGGRGSGDDDQRRPAYVLMRGDGRTPPPGDPRSVALARYLRRWAAAFSLSADVTDVPSTADAGMALLDAAAIADAMLPDDPRLAALSEAGMFEAMPRGTARLVDSPEIRAAIRRPLASAPQDGLAILSLLVATAQRLRPNDGPRP